MNKIQGTRQEICLVRGLDYTTYRTVNGVREITGNAKMNVLNYSYSSLTLPTFANQIETSVYNAWGDAIKASISGTSTASGACKLDESTFQPQKIAPLNSWKLGESFYTTTATEDGAIGKCQTKWSLELTNPGYTSTKNDYVLNEFRCDNAVGGNPRSTGCVVPWYPSTMVYSKAAAPELASHITRAQNSGLPGATVPLTRTTSSTVEVKNRSLACPTNETRPAGKSCDEYPLASTHQGLAIGGGERRTFSGCSISGVPSGTGAKGVSACMIKVEDQSYQGGVTSKFYQRQRVLNADPFLVRIGS
ncbi:hypothetical protein [Streptomyces sp. NPDC051546]|uniref:NucA/NucB deoxyribonuclease domain-containing protein n=1 Tax=Streptomyces sp. NPDC051546 TaxID=3365655 RepID=UPI0037984938